MIRLGQADFASPSEAKPQAEGLPGERRCFAGLRRWAAFAAAFVLFLIGGGRGEWPRAQADEESAWMEQDARIMLLYRQERYPEAAAATEEMLRQAVKRFGPSSIQAAKYQHNLAQLCALQHKEAEAELLYQSSLAIVEKREGADNPRVASLLEGYAALERSLGKASVAESMEARIKKIRERDVSRKRLWAQLSEQVAELSSQGRYEEASRVSGEALKAAEEIFAPNDPQLAQSISDAAEFKRLAGQLEQAQALQGRALAIREKSLGERHPLVARSLVALGHLYKTQRKYDKAQRSYQRALAIDEAALGKRDFTVANDLVHLAELQVEQGHYAAATTSYKRVIEIIEGLYGPEHPDVAMTLESYALALRKAGKPNEAQKAQERAQSLRSAAQSMRERKAGKELEAAGPR